MQNILNYFDNMSIDNFKKLSPYERTFICACSRFAIENNIKHNL